MSLNSDRPGVVHQGVHQLFERQARRFANDAAVICRDELLTYAELNGRANQLARHLRESGVGTGTLVVRLRRNLNMAVGISES